MIQATIMTPGFIFQAAGGPEVLFGTTALGPTVFHGSSVLRVERSAQTLHRFFEVMVVAQRFAGQTVVDASSPRHDSVFV
jgi:hypothetical protein